MQTLLTTLSFGISLSAAPSALPASFMQLFAQVWHKIEKPQFTSVGHIVDDSVFGRVARSSGWAPTPQDIGDPGRHGTGTGSGAESVGNGYEGCGREGWRDDYGRLQMPLGEGPRGIWRKGESGWVAVVARGRGGCPSPASF